MNEQEMAKRLIRMLSRPRYFSVEDLEDGCFELNVELGVDLGLECYGLPGSTQIQKARRLVEHAQGRGALFKLVEVMRDINSNAFSLSGFDKAFPETISPLQKRVGRDTKKSEAVENVRPPQRDTKEDAPRPEVKSEPPKSKIKPVKTKINFDWVTVPAGEFTMGSEDDDDEKPVHKIYLPEYQIARAPVTNEQWAVFLRESGYQWKSSFWKEGLPRGKEKHPVVYVSWNDAKAFCEWAGVRLPTEAEWEKAARGTDGRKYPWGNEQPTSSLCNYNHGLVGVFWAVISNTDYTTPVGHYSPQGDSPYGCVDMVGNVWEWCSSAYQSYPYKADDGWENLLGTKVLRGGSWNYDVAFLRASSRNWWGPSDSLNFYGFRCARSP